MSLAYKHYMNYNQELIDFDLASLRRRPDEIDLKFYHSILHGKTCIQPTSLFHPINHQNSKTYEQLQL